jgi:hypothetical protein
MGILDDPKVKDAFRQLEASAVEAMRGSRPRMVPGGIAQQWHDELEALSRKIGKYIDSVNYGDNGDREVAIRAARMFCEGHGITNETTIAALAGLIESHRYGAARGALQRQGDKP